MKFHRVLVLIALICIGLTAALCAQTTEPSETYENHSLLHLDPLLAALLPEFLGGGYDVIRILPDGAMKIAAVPAERDELVAKYGAIVEIENLEEHFRKTLDTSRPMGGYRTYDDTFGELYFWSVLHPDIIHVDTIGYSLEGRPIVAVKLSDNVTVDEDEPEVFYNALTHAREPITLELLLYYIQYLIDNRSEADISELINGTEMWFVPIVNPDGYVYKRGDQPERRRHVAKEPPR